MFVMLSDSVVLLLSDRLDQTISSFFKIHCIWLSEVFFMYEEDKKATYHSNMSKEYIASTYRPCQEQPCKSSHVIPAAVIIPLVHLPLDGHKTELFFYSPSKMPYANDLHILVCQRAETFHMEYKICYLSCQKAYMTLCI